MNKKKQIEEMARITKAHCELDNQCGSCHWETCNECLAEILYKAGYRKQSVGKWVFNKEKDEFFCSVCNAEPLIDPHFIGIDYGIEILSDFCPWCGAKMKGGAK